ncbi:MAG: tRNA (adenosine(37)-N6)-dimethylallyltransferase MiaA, partial [Rhizobiales bacterium]|nr:tRNA (adenosine(37)-N6)-dimethylallyltransferase MiaA [Hyphomicrobiales bacterium]
ALEVVVATGRPLAAWQRERGEPPLLDGVGTQCLVIEPDRELLHRRIEQRLDAMVEAGALAEVEALLAQGLDPALPAMKAIGVREFGDHLKGLKSLDAAIAKARTETRRYAKRQSTWFRHQMAHWQRIDPADADAG